MRPEASWRFSFETKEILAKYFMISGGNLLVFFGRQQEMAWEARGPGRGDGR